MDDEIFQAISSLERSLADRFAISNRGLIKSIKWIILAILLLAAFFLCLSLFRQIERSDIFQILLSSLFGLLLSSVFLLIYLFVRWQNAAGQRKHMDTLVKTIPGTVYRCIMDRDWTMVYMSDEIEKLSGYPASDFLKNHKRSYASIIHPRDAEHVERVVSNAIDSKRSFTIEYRIINSKNEAVWVYERGQAEYNNKGKVTMLNGTIMDISKRKQMETRLNAERSKLQKILDSSPVAAIIKTDSRISYANQRSKDVFGYREGDPIIDSYVNRNDRNSIMQRVQNGNPVADYPLQVYSSKGKVLDCMAHYYPVEFDGNMSMLGWYVDITAQKEIQQELINAKREVEQVIESMPVSTVVYDLKDLKVLKCNKAFLDFHSIDAIEYLDPDILEDPAENDKILQRIKKDMSIHNQELLVRRYGTGEFVLVQLSLHPMTYEGKDAAVVSFVDISLIKK